MFSALKRSVSTQVFIGLVALSVMCGAVIAFSVISHRENRVLVQRLHEGYVPLGLAVSELRSVQDMFVGFLDRYAYDQQPGFARQWLLEALRYRPRAMEPVWARLRFAETLDQRWAVGSRGFFSVLRKDLENIAQRYDESQSVREAILNVQAGDMLDVQRLRQKEQGTRRLLARVSERVQHQIRLITQDAYHEEQQATVRLALLGGLALLLALGIALWIRNVMRPLSLIRRRVMAIAAGQHSAPLQLNRHDELGLLAEEFERMLKAIGQRDAKLREATQRQRQQQAMQEQMFAVLDAAIVSFDRDGKVQAINPAARRLFSEPGRSVDRDANVIDLVTGLGSERWLQCVRQAQQGVAVQETLRQYREGVERVFKVSCMQVGSAENMLVVLVASDITQEVQAKADLIHAEKLAAMGRMAAHIAHEVRNPLSSLGLNLDLLEEDINTGSKSAALGVKPLMEAMRKEVERLTRITEEYLGVVRLPAPRLEHEDIVETVKSVVDLVKAEMGREQVEVELQVTPPVPRVMIDESQIRQALLNVLRNAREAMPEGGRVVIEIAKAEAGVAVRVRDEGIGMSEEQKARSFELFFTTKEKGTGLGLSLTRQISEAHGGRVRVLDSPGKGTIVELWIPALSS